MAVSAGIRDEDLPIVKSFVYCFLIEKKYKKAAKFFAKEACLTSEEKASDASHTLYQLSKLVRRCTYTQESLPKKDDITATQLESKKSHKNLRIAHTKKSSKCENSLEANDAHTEALKSVEEAAEKASHTSNEVALDLTTVSLKKAAKKKMIEAESATIASATASVLPSLEAQEVGVRTSTKKRKKADEECIDRVVEDEVKTEAEKENHGEGANVKRKKEDKNKESKVEKQQEEAFSTSSRLHSGTAVGGDVCTPDDQSMHNGNMETNSVRRAKKSPKVNLPFQRIDTKLWNQKIQHTSLKDNSFWSKSDDSFAIKAAHELGNVRGKDFRSEKMKKKRASWKGIGEIPMGINSVMFDSD